VLQISDWVAATVLLGSTNEKRATICLGFVTALEHCLRSNAFGTAMEILSGLNSTPVNILLGRWLKEGVC